MSYYLNVVRTTDDTVKVSLVPDARCATAKELIASNAKELPATMKIVPNAVYVGDDPRNERDRPIVLNLADFTYYRWSDTVGKWILYDPILDVRPDIIDRGMRLAATFGRGSSPTLGDVADAIN